MASTDEQPADDASAPESGPGHEAAGSPATASVDPVESVESVVAAEPDDSGELERAAPGTGAVVSGDPLLRPVASVPATPTATRGASASEAPGAADRPPTGSNGPDVPPPVSAPPTPEPPPRMPPAPPFDQATSSPVPEPPVPFDQAAPGASPWAPAAGAAPVGPVGPTQQSPAIAPTGQVPHQPAAQQLQQPARPAPSRRGAAAARASRSPRVTTQSGPGRRARVRRVTRVVRHVDPWSVFKISAVFCFIAYGIALLSGWLLWRVAYATGTIDNIESGLMSTGWNTFELHGDEIFRNAAVGGLFVTVGMIGLAVLTATLFNLVTDLVGGVRFTVLEEEVIEKAPKAPGAQKAGRAQGSAKTVRQPATGRAPAGSTPSGQKRTAARRRRG